MMQEGQHIQILKQESWPNQVVNSTHEDVNNVLYKKYSPRSGAIPNGILHTNILRKQEMSKSQLIRNGPEKAFLSDDIKLRWSVKNISKQISATNKSKKNKPLSTQPETLECDIDGFSSNISMPSQNVSGFDMAKLYPELSSKLGLIKPLLNSTCDTTSNASSKINIHSSQFATSPDNKSCKNHAKSFAGISQNIEETNQNNDKQITDQKILSDLKKFHKSNKLDITKLHIDKFNKLPVHQLNQGSQYIAVSPDAGITNPKNILVKQNLKIISLFDALCDKTFKCKFSLKDLSKGQIIESYCQKSLLSTSGVLSPEQVRLFNLYQEYYAYISKLCSFDSKADEEESASLNNFLEGRVIESDESLKEVIRYSRLKGEKAKEGWKSRNRRSTRKSSSVVCKALVEAARSDPDAAASTVNLFVDRFKTELPAIDAVPSKYRSSLLRCRSCLYENDEGGVCGERALPATSHCVRHITYNVDQQLFSQCVARREDNTVCRIPTFSVFTDRPLCSLHKHDPEPTPDGSSCDERSSKGKRSRRKPVSGLGCFGKRNKKRRRVQRSVSSASARAAVIPSSHGLGYPTSPSPLTPHTSPSFSTPCSDQLSNQTNDDELSDDGFGEMEDGLPIEARDIQDVLNRIPEDEFTQILYAPDGKLGECGDDDERRSKSTSHAALTSKTDHVSLPPLSMEEGALGELISTSFNQQELNAISQVLSSMVGDGNLDLSSDFSTSICEQTPPDSEPFVPGIAHPLTPPICYSEESNSVQSPPSVQSSNVPAIIPLNSKLKLNPAL